MSQDELERRLYRFLWDGAKQSASARAKRELSKTYQDEYAKLMDEYLGSYNPQIEVVETS